MKRGTKKERKLNNDIVSLCILMAVVICIAICTSGFFQYRNSIYQTYNNFAYQIADTALSYVDGNKIADYIASGKTDDAYDEMASHLYNIHTKSNITSIYLCIPNTESMTVTNIYDTRIHDAAEPKIYALGTIDPVSVDMHDIMNVYLTGEPANNYFIRQSRFGYNTAAIRPVANDNGEITALLIVDVPMVTINSNLRSYLIISIIITALIVVVFIAVFQIILRRRVINPLRLIIEETSDFIKSENVISKKLDFVNTHDEIENLAKSILHMETEINIYMENLTAITAEKERISAELDVAKHIQSSMLPCIFPPFPGRSEFDIYASMKPAKEVGGDFYDFFLIDDKHLAIVMADVSGKGVPAALFMVIAKTLIKNVTQAGLSPAKVLEKVNNQLCENNEAEMFVTVWLGVLEISSGKLVAANAGHEFPIIKKAGGEYELIKDKHGFVLAGMENMHYNDYELTVNAGDTLYLYTDGVPEATNVNNELFGTERMLTALNKNKDASTELLLKNIKQEIDIFVGDAPQFDDITMLAIKIKEVEHNEQT